MIDRWPLLAPPAPAGLVPGREPRTSVVIPTYQVSHLLPAALASLAAQTLLPDEVLVCDDGAPDGVDEAVRPFLDGPLQGRLRVLHLPHRGAGATRNAGTRESVGDVVVYLDADDIWLPDRLAALSQTMTWRPDLALVTTDAVILVDGVSTGPVSRERAFEVDDQRGALLERNYVFGHAAVRREPMLSCGGFDEHLATGEDWIGWQRLLWSGAGGFGEVPLVLAEYRRRSTSLTGDALGYRRDRVRMLEGFRRLPLSEPEQARLERVLSRERRRWARAAVEAGAVEARGASRDLVRDVGQPWRARATGLVGAVAPDLLRRAYGRRSTDR